MQRSTPRSKIITNPDPKCQCRNTINNRKSNMLSPELSCPIKTIPEQYNTTETQESNHYNDFMKMIGPLKWIQKKKSLKEIEKKKNMK